MASSNTNISKPVNQIADIRKVLGVSGGIGVLCTSNAINPKSLHKPMQHSSVAELTEAQRRENDYGWGGMQGTYGTQLYQVLNAKGAGQMWSYIKPTARYRHCDFNGYKHDADVPFKLQFEQDSYTTQQVARLIFSDNEHFNEMHDHFHEWGVSSNPANRDYLGLGIAFASSKIKTNWSTNDTYCLLVGYNIVTAWSDMDNEKNINIPAAFLASLGTGTWYGYPFILKDTRTITADATTRRVTGGMTYGGAIMMYQEPLTLTITTYNPLDNFSFSISGSCTGNEIAGTYSNFNITLTTVVSGLSGTASSQVVDFVIEHAGTSPNQDVTTTLGTASKSNVGNGTHYFTATNSGAVYPINYDPKGEGEVAITARVAVMMNGTSYSATVNGKINLL